MVGIQAVERAIAILQAFTPERQELGVLELARVLDLHKSTVSRLLATLQTGGLVERNPETGQYRLGTALIGLAGLVVAHTDVRETARPLLRSLAEELDDSINLGVLDRDMVLTIESFSPGTRDIKGSGWVGRRSPLHCTAMGKVLLAFRSEAEIERIIAAGLPPFTPNTISDPSSFRRELTQARQQGFATAFGELEEGLYAIAAPVHDYTGHVIGAITVYGPSYRIVPERTSELVTRTVQTAEHISHRLGFDATGPMRQYKSECIP
jgi:DNA-binding IclR family transcriptional regulator